MRKDIEFRGDDDTALRGWWFRPSGEGPFPTIVMTHGFGALKEMGLDDFGSCFAEAGFCVLAYDPRNLGDSDGQPRNEVDPQWQIRDYRCAISFVSTLEEVDETRIGIWGTSYSGGHVLVVAATDRRVRAVVSQVPTISGRVRAMRSMTADAWPAMRKRFNEDRLGRYNGDAPVVIPQADMAADTPTSRWFGSLSDEARKNWTNELTLRSMEMRFEYEPGIYISAISPTPLLMIVASEDTTTLTDVTLEAYERALEPKRLLLVQGDHYDVYNKQLEFTTAAARDWFLEHL